MNSRENRGCLPCRAHRGHGRSFSLFAEFGLLLPRSLVLVAVLVVVTEARVALAPSHRDADRRPWGRHHDVDTERLRERGSWPFDLSSEAHPFRICKSSVDVSHLRVHVQGCEFLGDESLDSMQSPQTAVVGIGVTR